MGVRLTSPVLIGRAAELEQLQAAIDRLATNGSAAVLIGGDAGVGKSRLLAEFGTRCEAAGARFLVGACLSLGETPYPFAPFVDAFRTLMRSLDQEAATRILGAGRPELARLLPELGGGPDGTGLEPSGVPRARFFEHTLGFLERLTRERPVVLGLEDLHWADRATLDLLRFLVRYARRMPLLLVGTYRTDELGPDHRLRGVLGEVERAGNVSQFVLRPLDRDEIGALVAAIRGERPAALVDTLLARSDGNPFVVEELLAAVGRDGRIDRLPDTLEDALLVRLDGVPRAARQVIRIVAVAGGWIDESVLGRVLAGSTAVRGLPAAVRSGLLTTERRGERDGYALRHALLGEAVIQALLPTERRHVHAALAAGYADAGPGIGQIDRAAAVARHLYEAQEFDRAFLASVEAGIAAQGTLAHADALLQFERAIELRPRVDRGNGRELIPMVELLERAADAAMSAGARERSVELLREAIAEIDGEAEPLRAGTMTYRLSRYLREAGDWPAAARELQVALAVLPPSPAALVRAEALGDYGRELARAGFVDSATDALDGAAAVAATLDASPARTSVSCIVAQGHSLCLLHRGDTARALATARAARIEASAACLPDVMTDLIGTESFLLDDLGRYGEVVDLALAGRERLKELGLEIRYGLGLMWRVAFTQLRLGQWAEVERTVEATLAEGPVPDKAAGLYETRAIVRARQGRAAEARQDLLAWRELVSAGAAAGRLWGGAETAVAVLEERWADISAMTTARIEASACRETNPMVAYDCYEAARAAAEEARRARRDRDAGRVARSIATATDRAELLHRIVASAERYPSGASPRVMALAAATDAERSRAAGTSDPAAWARTAKLWQELGMPFDTAYATYRQAEALLERRRARMTAIELLRDAHDRTTRLGAEPLRRDVEDLAVRARVDLAARARRDPGDRAGRRSLSDRERQVLALLTDGRSNREIAQALFISEKTASVHVTHIMDKFGVTSRAAAVALAVRGGVER